MVTPEQALYLAVMRLAVSDLVGGTRDEPGRADLIRKDAIAFFTDSIGPWADMRAEVCEVIDRDPDEVRAAIIETLEGGDLPNLGHVRGQQIEKSRALWRAQKSQNALIEAHRAKHEAKLKSLAKPAPVVASNPTRLPRIVRALPKPASPPPAKPMPPTSKTSRVKETRRADKPWKCPPRAPEEDFWYGIAPSA